MEKLLFDKDKFKELADRTPAFDYCKKCVEDNENDVNALFQLGKCYYLGIGTEANKKEARKIFKRVIKLDSTNKVAKKYNRKMFCGKFYWTIVGFVVCLNWIVPFIDSCEVKQKAEKEFKFYQELVDINPTNSESWYKLGKCYDNGYGTKENDVLAFKCYSNANEFDKKNAVYWNQLGFCYVNGIGTEINGEKVFECHKKALELDETDAVYWNNLGFCYLKGIGTDVDTVKAKELLTKAMKLAPDNEDTKALLAECGE